jgi:hypothetical protein
MLTELRSQIAQLQAERDQLAPWRKTRADAGAQLDAQVRRYAEQGAQHFATEAARCARGGGADPFAVYVDGRRVDLGPLLVGLLGAATVRKALAAALAQVPEDVTARVAEIERTLDTLEIEEEGLCVAHGLDRRPDARPEIVLAVE